MQHHSITPRRRNPLSERFWAKVNKTDSCWLWTGGKTKRGYGCINRAGRDSKQEMAHRISWELHFGAIPERLSVLHTCDNPSCVNPAHLFLGTQHDNCVDMVLKDRHIRGERQPHSKLTAQAVAIIRARYAAERLQGPRPPINRDSEGKFSGGLPAGHVSMASLAREYGVGAGTIQKIIEGHRWKHV